MDEAMVNSFSKFRLMEKEEVGIVLDGRDVRKCREECERSLVGMIWGSKPANFSGLKNTFSKLWSQMGDLRVVELGPNFYQFILTSQEEKERVLQKRPWFFDNQLIVLHQWRQDLKQEDDSFRKGLIWIQIRGLPNHWSSKEVGWKLSKLFPSCLNVVLPDSGSKEGRLLKLLVEVELDKPLLRGTKLKLDHEVIWVDFRYEQLPRFCYYCGRIGHQEKKCDYKMKDSREGCICEDQYGEWLRAPLVKGHRRGASVETDQEKRSEPLKLSTGGEQIHNEDRGGELDQQESSQIKGSGRKQKGNHKRLTWKEGEKGDGRTGRKTKEEREKPVKSGWITGKVRNNVEENKEERERQDSKQEVDKRAKGMEVDVGVQVSVQERLILKEMELPYPLHFCSQLHNRLQFLHLTGKAYEDQLPPCHFCNRHSQFAGFAPPEIPKPG